MQAEQLALLPDMPPIPARRVESGARRAYTVVLLAGEGKSL